MLNLEHIQVFLEKAKTIVGHRGKVFSGSKSGHINYLAPKRKCCLYKEKNV